MKHIRILIVEDDEDFRYLIQRTLADQPDFEISDLCGDGAEACLAARRHMPDIVLMDLHLCGVQQDGAEAARRIRLETDAKIIILTAYDSPETVISASVRAFASAYIVKSQFSLLTPTIRETAAGQTPQSYLICSAILSTLSPAERAVFQRMLGQDLELHSSAKTSANQQTSILHKLGLSSRQELIHIFSTYLPLKANET